MAFRRLMVISGPPKDRERTVQLLGKEQKTHLVRERHAREGQGFVGPGRDVQLVPQGPPTINRTRPAVRSISRARKEASSVLVRSAPSSRSRTARSRGRIRLSNSNPSRRSEERR